MKESIKTVLLYLNGVLAFAAIGQLGAYSTFVIIMFLAMWFKMINKDKEIKALNEKYENQKCTLDA